jgi:hypothetical protein
MTYQLNRMLIKLKRALHSELGMCPKVSLMIKEPLYRDEVLNRAELLGTEEIRRLAEKIRKISRYPTYKQGIRVN